MKKPRLHAHGTCRHYKAWLLSGGVVGNCVRKQTDRHPAQKRKAGQRTACGWWTQRKAGGR